MANYLVIGKNGTLGKEFEKLLEKQAICLDRSELDITDVSAVNEKIN